MTESDLCALYPSSTRKKKTTQQSHTLDDNTGNNEMNSHDYETPAQQCSLWQFSQYLRSIVHPSAIIG
jgi:hypothetical protein